MSSSCFNRIKSVWLYSTTSAQDDNIVQIVYTHCVISEGQSTMELVNIISIAAILFAAGLAAFYRIKPLIWSIVIGILLFLFTWIHALPTVFCAVAWVLFLISAGFANLDVLRRRYLVGPLLAKLQAQLPTISATEHEAIVAGNTWWEKELFCGRPNWQTLFSYPTPALTDEEQAFLDHQVEHLCAMLNDWEVIKAHDLPQTVWDYLKKEKFFGMIIPKQYGGRGFSALMHSTVIVKIATRCISAAVTTMVPNSLGPGELLVRYGTDQQKEYYLPRLANGTEIPCFALTAQEAGSDAAAIPDIGIVCKRKVNGQEVLGMRLNFDKRYITLAPVATLLGVAVRLYDPDHLIGEKEYIGITLCLIPTSEQGIKIGHRHFPAYLAFMNGPVRGNDVFVPLDSIIGGRGMAGQGWRMLMECLTIGRSISLPALSTACGKGFYRVTGAYAKVRRQFNSSIAAFEGVGEALGYIAGFAYMLDACRTMTAGAVDQDINPSTVSAIAKYHMTEMMRKVVIHAMDIHAGQAIQVGPRNMVANAYISVPTGITVEGANILTRNLIIFGQGAIRCHPYLLTEIDLLSQAKPAVKELDKILMAHIGFYVSNFIRNIAYGLTGGRFIQVPAKNPRIKKGFQQIARMSTALALLADTSLILLGGSLKRRERISARLGDILSYLYQASAVLKYFHDNNKPTAEIDYVCWSLQYCLYQIQLAADAILANFPNKLIGKLLKWIIFPWGRAYHAPCDRLHQAILTPMLEPSELRDRLTRHCFISQDDDEPTCRLEKAFKLAAAADGLYKKLSKAGISKQLTFDERVNLAVEGGALTKDEAKELLTFNALKNDVIQVNEFSFDLSKVLV